MNNKDLCIIDRIGQCKDGLSLPDIVKQTHFPKTTAYRHLEALTKEKVLQKVNNEYILGPLLLRWLHAFKHHQNYINVLHPYLVQISEYTEQTVHLVYRQDNKGIYVDKIEDDSSIKLKSSIGSEMELYSTAAGKAILSSLTDSEFDTYCRQIELQALTKNTITDPEKLKAEIKRFRKQGFSIEIEENEKLIQCVGVSFQWGDLHLAISITTTLLTPYVKMIEMSTYLLEMKQKIMRELGGSY